MLNRDQFDRLARAVERGTGSPWVFAAAAILTVGWVIGGLFVGFSDTYQLIINTFTTIVTFLMVFLIQATQSRDTRAIQLKLDELIRVDKEARNELMDLEDRTDDEIEREKQILNQVS